MGQWLTPDDAYTALRCVSVYIPSGPEYTGALLGALSLLRVVSSWEQFGAQSPEDTAAAFDEGWLQTLDEIDEECGESVAIPVGTVVSFAGTDVPAGWLACDGSSQLKANYPDLATAIGTKFGAGDETHFVLPDSRNRFDAGAGDDYSTGDTGGEAEHTLTADEMPSHRHSVSVRNAGGTSTLISMSASSSSVANYSSYTGGGTAHNNLPPYLAFTKIIYAGA